MSSRNIDLELPRESRDRKTPECLFSLRGSHRCLGLGGDSVDRLRTLCIGV